jgi:hypothetical protein
MATSFALDRKDIPVNPGAYEERWGSRAMQNMSHRKKIARTLVVATAFVLGVGCGASQGGTGGARLNSEAGTDALDQDADGIREQDFHSFQHRPRPTSQPSQSEVCGDGQDNDGDSQVDCDDAECALLRACTQ